MDNQQVKRIAQLDTQTDANSESRPIQLRPAPPPVLLSIGYAMSALRLPYDTLSPKAYQGLLQTKLALDKSSLGRELIELVNLRISQINGCSFCLEMHAASLRSSGVLNAKIDSLAGWRVSAHFDERERAALEWAESVVDVAHTHAPDEHFEPLKAHFSDTEISDLSFAIALMSAFNRLAISMRK